MLPHCRSSANHSHLYYYNLMCPFSKPSPAASWTGPAWVSGVLCFWWQAWTPAFFKLLYLVNLLLLYPQLERFNFLVNCVKNGGTNNYTITSNYTYRLQTTSKILPSFNTTAKLPLTSVKLISPWGWTIKRLEVLILNCSNQISYPTSTGHVYYFCSPTLQWFFFS